MFASPAKDLQTSTSTSGSTAGNTSTSNAQPTQRTTTGSFSTPELYATGQPNRGFSGSDSHSVYTHIPPVPATSEGPRAGPVHRVPSESQDNFYRHNPYRAPGPWSYFPHDPRQFLPEHQSAPRATHTRRPRREITRRPSYRRSSRIRTTIPEIGNVNFSWILDILPDLHAVKRIMKYMHLLLNMSPAPLVIKETMWARFRRRIIGSRHGCCHVPDHVPEFDNVPVLLRAAVRVHHPDATHSLDRFLRSTALLTRRVRY